MNSVAQVPEQGSELFPCFAHFAKRLHQRVSREASAECLWVTLIDELSKPVPNGNAQFVARCSHNKERRFWRIDAGDHEFTVIYDHADNLPITVLPGRATL